MPAVALAALLFYFRAVCLLSLSKNPISFTFDGVSRCISQGLPQPPLAFLLVKMLWVVMFHAIEGWKIFVLPSPVAFSVLAGASVGLNWKYSHFISGAASCGSLWDQRTSFQQKDTEWWLVEVRHLKCFGTIQLLVTLLLSVMTSQWENLEKDKISWGGRAEIWLCSWKQRTHSVLFRRKPQAADFVSEQNTGLTEKWGKNTLQIDLCKSNTFN